MFKIGARFALVPPWLMLKRQSSYLQVMPDASKRCLTIIHNRLVLFETEFEQKVFDLWILKT